MSEAKAPDSAHHAPSPFLPTMKMVAMGLGFAAVAFLISLGLSFLADGATTIDRVFNIFIKVSMALAFLGAAYTVWTDKPAAH